MKMKMKLSHIKKGEHGYVVHIFHDDPYRVAVGNKLTSPSFSSKGAAMAYAAAINHGYRKPEFTTERQPNES